MTSPNPNRTDDVSFGLALALLAAAIVTLFALGPIAILGVVISWLIVWATGRSSDALSLLLIGGTSVVALLFSVICCLPWRRDMRWSPRHPT